MSASAARMTWVMAIGFLLCAFGISFAQDADPGSQGAAANEVAPMTGMAAEPGAAVIAEAARPLPSVEPAVSTSKEAMAPQWIWGEVVAVDEANNQVQIKHLDYETYEEVTKVIRTDSGTLFENVGGIAELKAGDSVTVDFKNKDGAQMAELIVVDKNRVAEEPSAPPKPDQVSAATLEERAVPVVTQEPAVESMPQASFVEPIAPAEEPLAPGGMLVQQSLAKKGQQPAVPVESAAGDGSSPMGRI